MAGIPIDLSKEIPLAVKWIVEAEVEKLAAAQIDSFIKAVNAKKNEAVIQVCTAIMQMINDQRADELVIKIPLVRRN